MILGEFPSPANKSDVYSINYPNKWKFDCT